NNVVRNIIEDRLGNLWVVTHKGINRYDRNRDTFESYFTDLQGLPFQEYNTRVCLGPDSLLLVNVIGHGISKYNDRINQFESIAVRGLSPEWMSSVSDMTSSGDLLY